jgi:hypothetical protein
LGALGGLAVFPHAFKGLHGPRFIVSHLGGHNRDNDYNELIRQKLYDDDDDETLASRALPLSCFLNHH